MANFKHMSSIVAYEDTNVTNNPGQRIPEWRNNFTNIQVSNPEAFKKQIGPGEELIVFNGTRSITVNALQTYNLTLNPLSTSTYRLTQATGATEVGFRVDRGLDLSTSTITVTVNNNATATFTTSLFDFSPVLVGDTVFIPSVLTGDVAGPFSAVNSGFFKVIGKTSNSITVIRPAGVPFSATSDSVLLTTAAQMQAFSSSGVQIGDVVEFGPMFSPVLLKSFTISQVTANWIEFVSTESLPLSNGIVAFDTEPGITIYSNPKRWIRIESDQDVIIRLNGATGNSIRLTPRVNGSKTGIAWYDSWSLVWSLVIENKSTSADVNLFISTVE